MEKLAPKNPKELLNDHWVNPLRDPSFSAYLLITALKGVNNQDVEGKKPGAHEKVHLDELLWFHSM
jgi:hypothetical protein